MPLLRLSAEDANKNLRRRTSLWPDGRVHTDRFEGLAKVAFDASFSFSADDRIMTIGSCFARELEKRLAELGFDLPMLELSLPADERKAFNANDFINKYTVQSIVNELVWAFEKAPPPPQDLFLMVGEGLWHDPHLIHNLGAVSLERAIERRRSMIAAFRALPLCRVVVITLGLAEAWFDHRTGLHLNGAPPAVAVRREPERFSFDLLDYAEILAALESLHGLVTTHGHPGVRILLSVSPVPFKATFAGSDAIQANTYSKAVQRAAAEAFVRRHEDVDYIPSFEMVTLSDRSVVYQRDNVHVTPAAAGQIVNRVLSLYAPGVDLGPETEQQKGRTPTSAKLTDLRRNAKFLTAEKRYGEAAETHRAILSAFGDGMDAHEIGLLHFELGSVLLNAEDYKEAAQVLSVATATLPDHTGAWVRLGISLSRVDLHGPASEAFRRSVELDPDSPQNRARLATTLDALGRQDEALAERKRAVELDPSLEDKLLKPRRPVWWRAVWPFARASRRAA